MAKFVNINRNIEDPYYRYKMPSILAKVEGKGNGIKTVIANMSEIAKALGRPPTYTTKFFGCELGAQTNFDLKNDRYIVNGEHDANKLQVILDSFIRKFVLCPECDNPETTLTVRRQAIHSKCKACGHAYVIDSKHKIATFILKNPPPVEATEETKEKQRDSPTEDLALNGGKIEESTKIVSAEAVEEDDDWAPEPEQDKLNGEISKLVIHSDLEKPIEERLDMLNQYFVKAKEAGSLSDGKQLLNEAERLDLKNKAPVLLAQVLFTSEILNEIKGYRTLFLRLCLDDMKAQRNLLGGIEQFIEKYPDFMSHAPVIVKALYDNDLCSEDAILQWGSKPSSKFVKKDVSREIIKKCEPLLKWLEEAEEESDSEEEIAVDFDDRARDIGTVIEKRAAPAVNGKLKEEDSGDDDLDIENI